jgi:catechol 2,3-dioxygenase-like lactoylglutathione lyase family enzyme
MGYCFVIQPFDRGPFDKRYDDVFTPAIESAGLEPYRVDRNRAVRIPIADIEQRIFRADLCLADITADNPNVWCELGLAIASGKDVVLICSKARTGDLPFDIQHRNVCFYATESPRDFVVLRNEITARLLAFLPDVQRVDRPEHGTIPPTAPRKLHHVSLEVRNLDQSVNFYANVIGLVQVQRPKYLFKGAWFSMPGGQFLHLVKRRRRGGAAPARKKKRHLYRDTHFAVQVEDIDAAFDYLRAQNLNPKWPKTLPSRFPQVYIQDPDGYVIEFNVPPRATPMAPFL